MKAAHRTRLAAIERVLAERQVPTSAPPVVSRDTWNQAPSAERVQLYQAALRGQLRIEQTAEARARWAEADTRANTFIEQRGGWAALSDEEMIHAYRLRTGSALGAD